MKSLVWTLKWLLRAAIFFTLFAFALNNPNLVQLNFFFGHHWQAPLVLVVLLAFAIGVAVGALGMTPRWWRRRKIRAAHATGLTQQMPNLTTPSPNGAGLGPVSRPHGA